METQNIKAEAVKLIGRLSDDCTWDDIAYAVYVRQRIEAGLRDVEEGRLIDHEEIVREFSSRERSMVVESPE